ncbi:2058_t:CDS:2 [Dentiscutata erythropus]|uniref:SWR1-complex protein 5 n=1 Tax=Dentiscutata erythropus TaxID=1348616 RepID=A0A9N9NT43_9GLOM|nr:2058_t:CDS:2 [Dentiscutata erythropus]
MSTFEEQNFSSDSSEYSDFIPDENENEESSNDKVVMTRSKRKKIDHEANEDKKTKRLRIEETDINEQEIAQRNDKIDALWTEFNEDIQEPSTSVSKHSNSAKMITIPEIREFAGELITVQKQVYEDSEEAKAFLTSQTKNSNITQSNNMQESPKEKNISINQTSSPLNSPSVKTSKSPIASAISGRGKFGKPKKSTLGQLAASLSKKPKKLNTLEKSKIDWKNYVDQEGIVDELKYHNKNGYIEKQEFLQRTYEARDSEIKALRKRTRNIKIQNYIELNALTKVKRPFASYYSTVFKPKTSQSSLSPEPPTDPLPTPPPEPAGVNNPIDSLPPPDKTGSSITFPWIYGDQPPRIKHYPYPMADTRSDIIFSLLSLLPTFMQHELCKLFGFRLLKDSTSPAYFPKEFIIGEQLEQMFTSRLYDRYISEFEKIEKEKSTINIELLKIYGLGIRDIWFTIAPKKVITNRDYNIIQWMTSKIALPKISNEMSNFERRSRISFSAAKSFVSVINFKVDIEVDADVMYTLKSAKNEILVHDKTRRIILFRFESPYFEPTEKISSSKMTDNNNDISINWNWRIGDIDYLLEKEDLENKDEKESMV